VSQPITEDLTVIFDGGSAEPLTEGVGESPYKRRREEPRLNIQNLRPRDEGFFFSTWSPTVTNGKFSDASPFLVRQVLDVLLKRLWITIVPLGRCVHGKARKTLHKSHYLKGARGFAVTPTTVALLVARPAKVLKKQFLM